MSERPTIHLTNAHLLLLLLECRTLLEQRALPTEVDAAVYCADWEAQADALLGKLRDVLS